MHRQQTCRSPAWLTSSCSDTAAAAGGSFRLCADTILHPFGCCPVPDNTPTALVCVLHVAPTQAAYSTFACDGNDVRTAKNVAEVRAVVGEARSRFGAKIRAVSHA
jgi:hypothetical protein